MSHAVVLVNVGRLPDLIEGGYAEEGELPTRAALDGSLIGLEDGLLTDLMEPYNENTEVPRYRDYHTQREKARHIQSVTKDWEKYKATLDKRYEDPPSPRERAGGNPRSVDQATWERYCNEEEMAWENIAALYTDEEVATAYNAYWDKDTDGKLYVGEAPDDKHTAIYRWSTYNPQSKWDWYVVGGRWSGMLVRKDVDHAPWADPNAQVEDVGGVTVALARDLDWEFMFEKQILPSIAYLDEAEGWVERGRLIWFGMSDGDKPADEWQQQYRAWIAALPEDAVIAVVDYHI